MIFFVILMLTSNPSEDVIVIKIAEVDHAEAQFNSKLGGCNVFGWSVEKSIHYCKVYSH